MRIIVRSLDNKNQELKRLIKEYEDNFLNFYNIMNNCDTNWKDPNSLEFFKTVEIEKNEVIKTKNELNKISRLYDYIVNQYGEFGKSIYAELKQKNTILEAFDNFVDNINIVINSMSNIDASFSYVDNDIYREKKSLIKIKKDVIYIRNNIKEIIEELDSIETEINTKLNSIDIEYINETNIEPFLIGQK